MAFDDGHVIRFKRGTTTNIQNFTPSKVGEPVFDLDKNILYMTDKNLNLVPVGGGISVFNNNFLINTNGLNPVNQLRLKTNDIVYNPNSPTNHTTPQPIIDRWTVDGSSEHTLKIIFEHGTNPGTGILVYSVGSTLAPVIFSQIVENHELYEGQDITISAKIKSNRPVRLFISADNGVNKTYSTTVHSGTEVFETLTLTHNFTTFASDAVLVIGIEMQPIANGNYFLFEWIKAELGLTNTTYVPRTIGEEFLLCQLYFDDDSGLYFFALSNESIVTIGVNADIADALTVFFWNIEEGMLYIKYDGVYVPAVNSFGSGGSGGASITFGDNTDIGAATTSFFWNEDEGMLYVRYDGVYVPAVNSFGSGGGTGGSLTLPSSGTGNTFLNDLGQWTVPSGGTSSTSGTGTTSQQLTINTTSGLTGTPTSTFNGSSAVEIAHSDADGFKHLPLIPSGSNGKYLRIDSSNKPQWETVTAGGVSQHSLTGSDHTVSGLTTGHVLKATASDAFGFGGITDSMLPNDISGTKISDNTITDAKITGINGSKLVNASITGSKIADNTITDAKISGINGSKVNSAVANANTANTANALAVSRSISITGAVTGTSSSWDGSTNLSINTSVNHDHAGYSLTSHDHAGVYSIVAHDHPGIYASTIGTNASGIWGISITGTARYLSETTQSNVNIIKGLHSYNNDPGYTSSTNDTRILLGATSSKSGGINSSVISGTNCATMSNTSSIIASSNSETPVGYYNNTIISSSSTCSKNAGGILTLGSGSGSASTTNRKVEIASSGNIKATVSCGVGALDYVEYFENGEGTEILPGTLVTLNGDVVNIANLGDEIGGVVSHTGGIIAGDTPFCWQGRYLKDEWGCYIMEDIPNFYWQSEIHDPDNPGQMIPNPEPQGLISYYKENPDWDPEQEQTPRSERPNEWTPVGLLGQVRVRVDETVTVNSRIKAGNNGIGTLSTEKTGLRCMRINQPFDAGLGYAVAYCAINVMY